MSKILVVEEIPILRLHITRIAEEVLSTIGGASFIETDNEMDALSLYQSEAPDLVILDVCLAGAGGIKVAQHIWSMNKRAKVLFWTQNHREAFLSEIARVTPIEGVYGYVLKTEGDEKLRYAISSVLVHHNQYIDPQARKATARSFSRNNVLTDAEFETLTDIVLGLTDRAVAQRRGLTVRGVQNRLATMALKILRQDHWRLRQPQGMEIFNPRTRLILEAFKRGYISADHLNQCENDFQSWLNQELTMKHATAS